MEREAKRTARRFTDPGRDLGVPLVVRGGACRYIREYYERLGGLARLAWGSDMPNVELALLTYRQSLDYLRQTSPALLDLTHGPPDEAWQRYAAANIGLPCVWSRLFTTIWKSVLA